MAKKYYVNFFVMIFREKDIADKRDVSLPFVFSYAEKKDNQKYVIGDLNKLSGGKI